MHTELGDLIHRTRTSQSLTLQDLARRVGYRNANKGARRLERLECLGVGAADFVGKVVSSLGIARERIAELATRDEGARRRDFQAWLCVPQPMALRLFVAGVTIQAPLPEGITEVEAVAYAFDLQKREQIRVCLVLDRKRSIWINHDGKSHTTTATPDCPNFPYTSLR